MQSVSKAYKEQMQKGIRNPSYVLVEYDVFYLEAEDNAALADYGHTVFSSLDIKGRSESKPSYASFEPNRWKLDGSLLLLPTSSSSYQNTGYVSSAVSGSDGGFEVNPTITVTFSTPKTFYGFTMVFDEAAGEYPSEIAINGNRYFPTDVRFAAQEEIIEASSVTITFVNTGKPYRRARLTQLMFGQIMKFDSANLIQVSFSSKIDLLSTKLSQKSFTFVLDNSNQAYNPLNPSNLLQFAEERQPIKFQFGYELDDGTVEWVAPESLTLKGSPATKQMQASFTAQD